MDALLARTVQTLRSRFEALRPRGPVPALMAETPNGVSLPHRDTDGGLLPIFESSELPQPRWKRFDAVFRNAKPTARRDIFLAGDKATGEDLLRVCKEANGFVPLVRRHCGLPEDCGTHCDSVRWIWAAFEIAERTVPGSLLGLVDGEVFRCAGNLVRAGETDIALARERPVLPGDFVGAMLRQDFHPTRYWQLTDLVEASIMVMDIAEVAAAASVSNASVSAPPAPARPTMSRLETVPERLKALWNTHDGRRRILEAGSAEKIAHLVGSGKTAVVKAGKIWTEIKSRLKAQRTLVRYERAESEDRRES